MQARTLWAEIDALDYKVSEQVQIQALTAIWHLQRNLTRWLLSRPGQRLDIARMVERYQQPLSDLLQSLPAALMQDDRTAFNTEMQRLVALGMSGSLAHFLASIPYLNSAMDIIELATVEKQTVSSVAQVHYALSESLHIKWLMDSIEALPVTGRWQAQARGVLADELQAQQRQLVSTVLLSAKPDKLPSDWVSDWLSRDDAALKYTLGMLADMRGLGEMDFPTLSVAVRRLAQIASTGTR
jgi:glutamate dehydrogenase